MKPGSLSRLLLLICLFTSMPSASGDNPSVLDQSINLSQRLGGGERLFYLIELCNISPRLNASRQQITEWSTDLFQVASGQQDMLLRAVGQKNAVACLSNIDPQAAMDLLTRIDFRPPAIGEWVSEDPRYNAVDQTFTKFLNKVKPPDVSELIDKAKFFGRTGQYPYNAMANVIKHKPGPTEDEVNSILTDALSFYVHETGFYNRDEEFRNLLHALDPSMDKELTSRLVAAFVQKLTNDPIQFPGDYYSEVHIPSNGKVFPFTDRNAAFMFQDFPIIRRFNPELALEMSHEIPQLTEAADKMNYISGGFIQGNPTSDEAAKQHFGWLQTALLKRIQTIKERPDCDPKSALDIVQRLSDPSSRIVGFAMTVPAIAKGNPSQAHVIFDKQLSELDNLEDVSSGKLSAMVEVAEAAYSLGELQTYQRLSNQAFNIGVKKFNSNVKPRVQRRDGFSELRDLVMFSSSQPNDILQSQVNNLPDGWLKTYLWLYQKEAQSKRTTNEMSSGSCPE